MKKILFIIFLLLPIAVGASVEVKDDEFGFKLLIPDGFRPYNKLAPHSDQVTKSYVASNALYSFNKGGNPEGDDWTGIFIDIERSPGNYLGFKPEELLSANESVSRKKWGSCDINIFRIARNFQTMSSKELVGLNFEVPLKPKPILIKLTGIDGDEEEMNNTINMMLNSLEGKSDCGVAKNNNYKILLAVLIIILVIIIIKKLRKIKK